MAAIVLRNLNPTGKRSLVLRAHGTLYLLTL
jgi:hypothetical protein